MAFPLCPILFIVSLAPCRARNFLSNSCLIYFPPCPLPHQNYYYERWMTGRVLGELPNLPPCVAAAMVKKLDADDLDLMLKHPAGLAAQVMSAGDNQLPEQAPTLSPFLFPPSTRQKIMEMWHSRKHLRSPCCIPSLALLSNSLAH